MENIAILDEINSSNYLTLKQIYKPQVGYSGFVTNLKLTIDINSISAAFFPYIPDDTPPDVLEKVLEDVAAGTHFKEIKLLLKKGAGAWVQRGTIRLFNKEPYYDVNLMAYLSDSNTIDVAEDLAIGLQMVAGNDGILAAADKIIIFGTVVEEKKNNGNEELAARIEALELALNGRLTNLPANSLLGRGAGVGTVELLPQNQFLSATGTQSVTGDIRVLKNGGDSIVSTLYFANTANNRAWNWQLTADGTAGLFGFDGAVWGQKLNIGHGVITAANPPSTYGSIAFGGSKNGYAGINFPGAYGSPVFMLNAVTGIHGIWHPTVAINGWNYYYNQGDFRVFNFEAQTEGTFIGLAKGIGSLPGYPNNRYPTLKTDFGSLFFSINGGYAASINANGTYTAVSDKYRKENKQEVDYETVLEGLKNVKIYTYNFIGEDTRVRRMSCFAQDFYEAYGLGGDDEIDNDNSPTTPSRMLSPMDAIGVCMAAIKGLQHQVEVLQNLNS